MPTTHPILYLDCAGQVWRAVDEGTHLMLDPTQLLQPHLTLAELHRYRGPVSLLVPSRDAAKVVA